METLTHPVSPLRQRMLEDMRMRKLAPKTRDCRRQLNTGHLCQLNSDQGLELAV
jgi:hypothetical protein